LALETQGDTEVAVGAGTLRAKGDRHPHEANSFLPWTGLRDREITKQIVIEPEIIGMLPLCLP
jgi:hypothetical protein